MKLIKGEPALWYPTCLWRFVEIVKWIFILSLKFQEINAGKMKLCIIDPFDSQFSGSQAFV